MERIFVKSWNRESLSLVDRETKTIHLYGENGDTFMLTNYQHKLDEEGNHQYDFECYDICWVEDNMRKVGTVGRLGKNEWESFDDYVSRSDEDAFVAAIKYLVEVI